MSRDGSPRRSSCRRSCSRSSPIAIMAASSTPGPGHEALIARQKDAMDNATPSGNAMAATALLRLATADRTRGLPIGRRVGLELGTGSDGTISDGDRPESDRARLPSGEPAGIRGLLRPKPRRIPGGPRDHRRPISAPQSRRAVGDETDLGGRAARPLAGRSSSPRWPGDHLHLREFRLPRPIVGAVALEQALKSL